MAVGEEELQGGRYIARTLEGEDGSTMSRRSRGAQPKHKQWHAFGGSNCVITANPLSPARAQECASSRMLWITRSMEGRAEAESNTTELRCFKMLYIMRMAREAKLFRSDGGELIVAELHQSTNLSVGVGMATASL
ncbi:hypothetical protein ACQJBY_015255 [Aegilops geniculata]